MTGTTELVLAHDGRHKCAVVSASVPDDVTGLAARELATHLTLAFGEVVPVVDPVAAAALGADIVRLVVGDVDKSGFAAEEYAIRTDGNTIHLGGHNEGDLFGTPREIVGQSSPGTLYAVYHFLDHYLGVRWLWPGKAGTYVPRHKDLRLGAIDVRTRPDLEQRCLRAPLTWGGQNPYRPGQEPDAEEAAGGAWERVCRETILWGYRQHMGSRTDLRFTHSYPHWWETYHEEHPELFAHPPAGQAQPFPAPNRVKLCVSHPGVADTIVEEWRQAGRPASWCVGPNDGNGWCTCADCRALDGIEHDEEDIWLSRGVCLTGRYTHLWNQLLPRLRAERADARLSCYAYSTYRDTLPDTRLHEGMVLAVVHTYDERARRQWGNWSQAGAALFLRPNWFHMGACYPHLPLHRAGSFVRFAREHAMAGIWFDSLMGYWSTQGPFYYLIGRMGARPDLSVDDVIDEYCSAFGNAAPVLRRFLDYWETRTEELAVPVPAGGAVTQDADGLHERTCRDMKITNHPLHASWRVLPTVAADEVLAPARDLLEEARAADGSREVTARIDFLADGLDHLARLRDLIELCHADELPAGTTAADVERLAAQLARWQDELTPRHVVWGPLLRQTLVRRNVRTACEDAGDPELDGV